MKRLRALRRGPPARASAHGLAVRAVAALVVAHVGLAGAVALIRSARHLTAACLLLDEDPEAARRRVFGPAYVAAIEGIRRAVTPDGAYLVVDAQEHDEGSLYWVRFDLAPRRAHLVGMLHELAAADRVPQRPGKALPVVIAYGDGRPPRLVDHRALWGSVAGAPP